MSFLLNPHIFGGGTDDTDDDILIETGDELLLETGENLQFE